MKAKIVTVSILTCLLAATLPLWAAEAPIDAKSIIGSWKISSTDTGEGVFPISGRLTVSKKTDGTIDVQYTGGFGGGGVSGAKLDGKKLTFVVTSPSFDGGEMKTNYEFAIQENGKLSGKTAGGRGGERELAGTRIWPKPDCVGQWEVKIGIPANTITPRIVIAVNDLGQLIGKWTMRTDANETTIALLNIKFEKGKLSFNYFMKIGENQVFFKFEGEVKGDDLSGISTSDKGERFDTYTRVGKDLIGEWDLNINSDMGDMTGKLVIDKDLSAVYTMYFGGFGGDTGTAAGATRRGFDMDISNLKVSGSNVTFTAGFGQFNQEFKGKVTGDKIDGEMTSDMGTSKITGKKVVPPPKPAPPTAPAKTPAAAK